ncbi:MAG: mandelate racemase/muconate lactonizing enzyme family protein, partial [Lentisphaeria bacterium]|nr:mandelate racemase/muconate lactonizing enzyme family protein [Lentisphaeria bacterium]
NEAWTVAEATRNLDRLDEYNIDFAEQPVPADPIENMLELKQRTHVPLSSNEGLWRVSDACNVIKKRACDVLCFSPYWVGSLSIFKHLSTMAAIEGLTVCKHTHGELGIAAAASHQVLLTLPKIVDGHQHTASIMEDDLVALPIVDSPDWGVPEGTGLCINVDEEKVLNYHEHYKEHGQYLPYDLEKIKKEGMP